MKYYLEMTPLNLTPQRHKHTGFETDSCQISLQSLFYDMVASKCKLRYLNLSTQHNISEHTQVSNVHLYLTLNGLNAEPTKICCKISLIIQCASSFLNTEMKF